MPDMAVTWSGAWRYLFGGLWNPDKGRQLSGPNLGRTSDANVTVTDTRAMQIAACFRCVRIIAETCASLPLVVYKKLPNGDREPAPDHWLQELLDRPNDSMTGDEWRESQFSHMAGWGNGYSQVVRDATGRPRELWPLKCDRMTVDRLEDWSLAYRYPDGMGVPRAWTPNEVLHLRAFSHDGVMGLSPLGLAREALGLTIGSERFAGSFFGQGGRPVGVLKASRPLTPAQREQIRQEFSGLAEGDGTTGKRLWVLEAALDYQQVSLAPSDMQMLETRQFQISELARFFGVPLFLLMVQENTPNWGLEQQNLAFLTYTLRAYLTRLETTVARRLLTPQEQKIYFCEHDVEPLLRADKAALAAYYSSMAQNGVMDRNEIRRKMNLPARTGADRLTAQTNLSPLEKLGEQPRPTGAGEPSAPPSVKLQVAPTMDDATLEALEAIAGKLEALNRPPPLRRFVQIPRRGADGRIAYVENVEEFQK